MAKRISAVFFLIVIFSVFAFLGVRLLGSRGDGLTVSLRSLVDGEFSTQLETFAAENIPAQSLLKQMAVSVRLAGGAAEIDGVLVGDTMLMKNIQPPDEAVTAANQRAILNFADQNDRPTYVMLLPTACAIKQQELPEYMNLFNQRSFIDSVYTEMSGAVSVVDTYLRLLSGMDGYIYYRTLDNLTPMGGYLVYEQLGTRLGISPLRAMDQFDIDYGSEYFYGDLYQTLPVSRIRPDRMLLYRFSKYRREYKVTHHSGGVQRTYYTLFPEFVTDLAADRQPYEVILGGFSPVITITSSTSNDNSLLIFADETVFSYIPFLLVHYSDVAIVDVEHATEQDLSELNLDAYNQVLFGVSVDTYMHSDLRGAIDFFLKNGKEDGE